jgi:hypothetical protein
LRRTSDEQSFGWDEVDLRLQTSQVVEAAADLARYILREDSERLEHSSGVAERAKLLTVAVQDDEAPLRVARPPGSTTSGTRQASSRPAFTRWDGAQHLRATGWPELVRRLVAHHSGSRFVAQTRGLDNALAEFDYGRAMP